jgi:hypothetical protein
MRLQGPPSLNYSVCKITARGNIWGSVCFAEIWLITMLMLICYERKTLFVR